MNAIGVIIIISGLSFAGYEEELRKVTRTLVETLYYTIKTRNIFPIPQPITQKIEKNLNYLAEFIYPNQEERSRWIAGITETQKGQ